MTRQTLLVFGSTGQVGRELSRSLQPLGTVISLDRAAADLSKPETLAAQVQRHRPSVVVLAAAYTAVDRAESEPDLAHTINAEAPRVIARAAEAVGASVVYYSTDYVFDGTKIGAYVETDATNPLGVYGATKLAGEIAVASGCARHLVFRTSWAYATHGANFLKTVLRLAAERDELRVVADQHGVPTSAGLIADVTAKAITALSGADSRDPRWGLYNLVPTGATTWHEYARRVIAQARAAGMTLNATPEAVAPITTAEYPTPAKRPLNSRLDPARLQQGFAVSLPHWTRDVDGVVAALAAAIPRQPKRKGAA